MFEKTETKTTPATRFTIELDTGRAFVYSVGDGTTDVKLDKKDTRVAGMIDFIAEQLDDMGYISADVETDKAEFVALVDSKLAVAEAEPVVLEK